MVPLNSTSPSAREFVPIVKASIAVAIWGVSFVSTKVSLTEVAPSTIVWIRFGMGVLVLLAVLIYKKQFKRIPIKDVSYFAFLGFLGITFHQWLQTHALQTISPTTTSWIVTTTPVFMALLGWVLLREYLGWQRILGIGIATFGVIMVVSHGAWDIIWSFQFGTLGDFLILLSALNWAFFSVASRRVLQRYEPALMMFYVMLFGWLFSCLEFFFAGNGFDIDRLTSTGWNHILFLGIFCSGVAYIFWYDSLKVLKASQVGALLYFEPITTLIFASWYLGEIITLASLVGGGFILIGVWLVNKRYITKETSS